MFDVSASDLGLEPLQACRTAPRDLLWASARTWRKERAQHHATKTRAV